jgi:hypothetical protein
MSIRNAIAGRHFASWAELEGHLARWMREVAEIRIHGTTGEAPVERFRRDEGRALTPLPGRPPFRQVREVVRRVHADGCIDLDTNRYSVPWRLIGALVTVQITAGELRIVHGGIEVARHAERHGRRERSIEAAHLIGIVANDVGTAPASLTVDHHGHGELLGPWPSTSRPWGRLVSAEPDRLTGMLARLGLKATRDRLDNLLDEASRRDLSVRDALDLLCEAEVRHREERRIQMGLGIAKFPFIRTLDGFDFEAQPSLDPKQVRDLATCRWIANGDALLVLGPPEPDSYCPSSYLLRFQSHFGADRQTAAAAGGADPQVA